MIKITSNARNKAILAQIDNLAQDFRDGIRKGLQQSGIDIAGKQNSANDGLIKQDMNSPKHGRTYGTNLGRAGRVLKRTRLHTASAPGEAPAVITGRLRKSIYYKVEGSNQLRIGANTPYAAILEKGGNAGHNHASHIAPRPYLKKNILKSRQDIEKNIISSINNKIK